MLHEFDEVELDVSPSPPSYASDSRLRPVRRCEHAQTVLIAALTVALVFTGLVLALTALLSGVRPADRVILEEEPRQTASPAPSSAQPTIPSTVAPVTEAPPSPPPDTQEIGTFPPVTPASPPPTSAEPVPSPTNQGSTFRAAVDSHACSASYSPTAQQDGAGGQVARSDTLLRHPRSSNTKNEAVWFLQLDCNSPHRLQSSAFQIIDTGQVVHVCLFAIELTVAQLCRITPTV